MRRPHNVTENLITSIANFFIFASLHCDVMIDSCLFKLFTLLFSLYYVMIDSFLNVLRNNTSEVTRRSVADIVAPIAFVIYLQVTKIETIQWLVCSIKGNPSCQKDVFPWKNDVMLSRSELDFSAIFGTVTASLVPLSHLITTNS